MDDAQLRTVWQQRQLDEPATLLGESLAVFMKRKLAKRVRQLSSLAAIWDEVIPEEISRHTALEGLHRGVLTVLVDSAPHRFQLKTLLDAGLKAEIRARYGGPLNRVRLVPGQFFSVDVRGAPRYEL